MTAALYVLTGFATGLLWAHRHAAAAAIWRAVDWLCGEDPPPVAQARPCVRVRRDGGQG